MTVPEIPTTQKVAWISNVGPNGTLDVRDGVPVPQPGENEVLVKMECTGICRSDCHNVKGQGVYTEIPGHEGVGIVVQLGTGVSQSLMGKRVGLKWLYSACNACSACKAGYHNNCPNQKNTGKSTHGTLQQYFVAHADFLTMIPDGVSSEVAAPLLCAGLSLAGAVSLCEPELSRGDWVVIVGAGGGLGHLGVAIATKSKGYKVITIDTGAEKEALCMEMGATTFVDFMKEDPVQAVKDLTDGEGAHAVICVAGSEKAYEQSPGFVRNRGLIICVGLPPASFMFPMSPGHIALRGITVKGASVGTEAQMDELLQEVAKGNILPKIEVYDFEKAGEIIEELWRYEVTGRKVVRAPV